MSDRQETTADIIAAMRDEAARADMEQEYSIDDAAEMMREFAWRFEAAHKREAVTDCNQLGDAAKLREALRRCRNCAQMIPQFVQASRPERSSLNASADYANLIIRDVDEALAAPPRNCDRHECATIEAAVDAWRQEDGGKTAYYEWLFATYKKGGNDGK